MHAVTGIQMPPYRIEQMLFRDNWATAVYVIFIFYLMDLAPLHFDQSASSETKAGSDTDRGGRSYDFVCWGGLGGNIWQQLPAP